MALDKSVENTIVDEVVDRLGEIFSANSGFYSDPVRIYRLYGNAFELPELPAVIVTPLMTALSHDCPNGLERVNLRLAITCVMDANADGSLRDDFSELDRQIRNMATDVRKALQADLKRGALAIDTIIDSVDIFQATQAQPVAAAEVTVTIPFRHRTADPTQAF